MGIHAALHRLVGRRVTISGAAKMVLCGGMLLGLASFACAQAPAAPKVEVRGVRIVGPAYGKGMEGLRAFNWTEGTSVALLVTSPDGGIISIDKDKTKLTKLADDKGTDLTAGEGRSVGSFPHVSTDGKACLIDVDSKKVPAKGATAITVAGVISLQCGSKKEIAKQENVSLKVGTKIAAGPVAFEISKVGKPEYSFDFTPPGDKPPSTPPPEKFEVTLSAKQDCSNIASIVFLDAAGKDLGAKSGSSSTMRMGASMTVEKSFILPKKIDVATVSITYWADLKEVAVPFDLKATLGL